MTRKLAPLIVVGAFIGIGAVNAMSEAATGHALLDGDSGASSQASTTGTGNEASVAKGGWARPVNAKVTTAYKAPGPQWSSGFHTGVDMAAPAGTQVFAARSGKVVNSDWGGPYGNQIVIRHGDKLYTHYAHLLKQQVRAGQEVKAGDKIGLVGATGTKSSGPHLHFEVRTGPAYGSDINPVPFLKEAS